MLNHSKIQEIHINRNSESILRDVFKKMKRGEVDAKALVDITFIEEEGIDAEGLTKEFFPLL